jgi:exosortase
LGAATEMTSGSPRCGLDIRAVVLVGGRDFGRCPLAAQVPTALWPVVDRPALAHVLDRLADTGLGRVAVCCARNDVAAVTAACQAAPLEVTLVAEELTAGTAGSLRDAISSDPGDLIVVVSGSMVAPPRFEDLIQAHQANGAQLTIVFNPSRGGETSLDDPAEIYLCRPQVLHHIPHGGYCDIKEGLIPSLLRAGGAVRLAVLEHQAGNFRNRAGYLDALGALFRSAADDPQAAMADGAQEALVRKGAEVSVHPTTRIRGPVLVGNQTRLAEGVVVIGPAVIGCNVVVDPETVIVRSAVWADARVGAQCEIRESIVDQHAALPAGTTLVEKTASGRQPGRRANPRVSRFKSCETQRAGEYAPLPSDRQLASGSLWAGLGGWTAAYAAGGLVLLAALLWSYWPTVLELVETWRRSDEYSSGLLVPFLAAYVLWLRRQDLRATAIRPALLGGIGAFIFAQAVRVTGLFDLYSFLERFSILLSLAALVLLVLGWRYLAKLAPVLLFLCLMLPWPNRIQSAITVPLQKWSTTSAVFCLELAGYEIRQDGNVIHIGDASVAVAEACNGLRMITAFFVISGLVVLLVKRTWWEKLIVLGSSLPIAFFCNTLRLAVTAVFFTLVEGEDWERWFHDWGGYAMMPLALALVVGELWLLARLTIPPLEIEPAIISRRNTQQVPDP